jgi:hypothetical protein
MSRTSGRSGKERRDVYVNTIRRDHLASKLENVGKRKADDRRVVARVSHFSFAARKLACAPESEESMPARGDRCEKSGYGSPYLLRADHLRGVSEPKSRVRREKCDESLRIARIDGREQSLPPFAIGNECSPVRAAAHLHRRGPLHDLSIRAMTTSLSGIRG